MKTSNYYTNRQLDSNCFKKLFFNSNLVNTSIPGVIPGLIPEVILDDMHLINSSIVLTNSLNTSTEL